MAQYWCKRKGVMCQRNPSGCGGCGRRIRKRQTYGLDVW